MKAKFRLLYMASVLTITLGSCKKNETINSHLYQEEPQISLCNPYDSYTYTEASGIKTSGVGVKSTFWPSDRNGPIVIPVKFVEGGSDYVRNKVKFYAKEWERYANVRFDFVAEDQPAVVRIRFNNAVRGANVTVPGNYLLKNYDRFNMHYGDLTDLSKEEAFSADVLHEFGHVLGLKHEQEHFDIKWDKPYIYEYFKRKRGWDQRIVDRSFFSREIYKKEDSREYGNYDVESIMHYPYPEGFIIGAKKNFSKDYPAVNTDWGTSSSNHLLSEGDKKFIQKIYPFPIKELFRLDGCSHQACKNDLGIKQHLIVAAKKTVRDGDLIIVSGSASDQPFCRVDKDRYLIKDSSGKTYPFTSNTGFDLTPTETGLKSPILIQKNGKVIFSNN